MDMNYGHDLFVCELWDMIISGTLPMNPGVVIKAGETPPGQFNERH